jgi:hypothetical protein
MDASLFAHDGITFEKPIDNPMKVTVEQTKKFGDKALDDTVNLKKTDKVLNDVKKTDKVLDSDTVKKFPIKVIHMNGGEYDLSVKAQAEKAFELATELRQQLKAKKLMDYDGKSTEWGKGGRSALLYDEVRARMAVDFHNNQHTLTWDQQDAEAKKICLDRAKQTESFWKK